MLGSAAEARWLIEEVADAPWPGALDAALEAGAQSHFEKLVARRAAGEPLQYVLGHWAFRHLEVLVDRRVLIPRPETETTVEVALHELDRHRGAQEGGACGAVDLGTGSGAIALCLVSERRALRLWATDASAAALEVARANVAALGGRPAARIRLLHGHWWDALPPDLAGRIDLVVSNPPYLSQAEMADLDPVVGDWEPPAALQGGDDGLRAVAEIVGAAGRWLAPGASLVVEIAPHQSAPALAMAGAAGLLDAQVRLDLAGRPRVLVARNTG